MHTPLPELPRALERLTRQLRELQHELEQLKQNTAAQAVSEMAPIMVGTVPVVAHVLPNGDPKMLGTLADRLIQKGTGVAVLATTTGGKVVLIAKVAPEWTAKGLHAGNLVRALAQHVGGSGGGKPDFAQAGGKQPENLSKALSQVPHLVQQQLSGGTPA
ncbi:MAG: hypothetical protein C4336_05800 [Armatimonadota bacterium]